MAIALEFHCIKKNCLYDTILICSSTLSHPTMSIHTRISIRWTSMCFRFLMTKAALAIPWWSAVKISSVSPIHFIGRNTMRQSQKFIDFSKILQNKQQLQFCLGCLGHFSSEEVLARHKKLCTRDDFMSALHVLPVPGSKHAQIKFNQYKYCTKAPFVIYADFESIVEPSGRQVKHTTYTQQHKVCAAAAILTSSSYNFDQ